MTIRLVELEICTMMMSGALVGADEGNKKVQ